MWNELVRSREAPAIDLPVIHCLLLELVCLKGNARLASFPSCLLCSRTSICLRRKETALLLLDLCAAACKSAGNVASRIRYLVFLMHDYRPRRARVFTKTMKVGGVLVCVTLLVTTTFAQTNLTVRFHARLQPSITLRDSCMLCSLRFRLVTRGWRVRSVAGRLSGRVCVCVSRLYHRTRTSSWTDRLLFLLLAKTEVSIIQHAMRRSRCLPLRRRRRPDFWRRTVNLTVCLRVRMLNECRNEFASSVLFFAHRLMM